MNLEGTVGLPKNVSAVFANREDLLSLLFVV